MCGAELDTAGIGSLERILERHLGAFSGRELIISRVRRTPLAYSSRGGGGLF